MINLRTLNSGLVELITALLYNLNDGIQYGKRISKQVIHPCFVDYYIVIESKNVY